MTSCQPMRAHLDGEQQPAGHLSVVVGRGEGLGQLQVKHVLGTVYSLVHRDISRNFVDSCRVDAVVVGS